MIRSIADWQTIAWLIGWVLAWLMSWLPSPARAGGWDDIAVKVTNQRGPIADVGSGTLAAGNGTHALIITCKHLFDEGRGSITVQRPDGARYPARLLGVAGRADIAALEIPDPGARTLAIAKNQAQTATLIGWGGSDRVWKDRGHLVQQTGHTAFYSFRPLDGDSGGGVFDENGALVGVVWGTDGNSGAVVPLADLREALDSPTLDRFTRNQAASTKQRSQTMIPTIILASMIGQLPPMPDKGLPPAITSPPPTQLPAPDKRTPRATPQATPQATPVQSRSFVPAQQYEYQRPSAIEFDAPPLDIPVRVRLRPSLEIAAEGYAPAPRQQVYAPPQAIYSGGGCYGGSFSAGSYGVSRAASAPAFEVFEAPSEVICVGGRCVPIGSRLSARNRTKIKYKSGPGGLRGLLGG